VYEESNQKNYSCFVVSFFISSLTAITVSAQPTEATNQDTAWLKYVFKYATLINNDLTNIGTAVNNADYSALSTASQKTIGDIQEALDKNGQYTVSTKYQKAQTEWVSALRDSKSTVNYFIRITNDAKKGTVDPKKIEKATCFSDAAAVHFYKAAALIKAIEK
jgi:hypothetical protein